MSILLRTYVNLKKKKFNVQILFFYKLKNNI